MISSAHVLFEFDPVVPVGLLELGQFGVEVVPPLALQLVLHGHVHRHLEQSHSSRGLDPLQALLAVTPIAELLNMIKVKDNSH